MVTSIGNEHFVQDGSRRKMFHAVFCCCCCFFLIVVGLEIRCFKLFKFLVFPTYPSVFTEEICEFTYNYQTRGKVFHPGIMFTSYQKFSEIPVGV